MALVELPLSRQRNSHMMMPGPRREGRSRTLLVARDMRYPMRRSYRSLALVITRLTMP